MNVLVTGGAGFIGSHLVDALSLDKRVNKILIIDDLSSGLISNIESVMNLNKNIELINLDISSELASDKLEEVMKKNQVKIIFHLAAKPGVPYSMHNPKLSHLHNDIATMNVLDSAKIAGVKRVVYSSSSSIYGGTKPFPTTEEDNYYLDYNPKSPYAQYKVIGEQLCKMYSNVFNLDTVCLRYFNIFGPRQRPDSPYAAVIASFAYCAVNDKIPTIYGDGNQFRDMTYVQNAVMANILAGFHNKNLNGESFNVGTGNKISINDIHRETGALPAVFVNTRTGDVQGSHASIDKISKMLGYKVFVDFDEGMKRTMEWHRSIK